LLQLWDEQLLDPRPAGLKYSFHPLQPHHPHEEEEEEEEEQPLVTVFQAVDSMAFKSSLGMSILLIGALLKGLCVTKSVEVVL